MKAEILSNLYRATRRHVINQVYKKQDAEGRMRDLEEVVEIGDRWLKRLPRWTYSFKIPEGIGAEMHDLWFPSPLTLSSFKEDAEIIDIWMQLGLGGAVEKTWLQDVRAGNKRPRLQECGYGGHSGLINAMGWPSPGIQKSISEHDRVNLGRHGRPIGISLAGNSEEEYYTNFDIANQHLSHSGTPHYYFEESIGCPNTQYGRTLQKSPGILAELLRHMRSKTDAVIVVKLSPDVDNPTLIEYVNLIAGFPRTAVNLGNTQRKNCAEAGLPDGAISVGAGGLSGPALYPRTLEMVKLAAPIGIPIIATGGVDSAQKARELLDAGASLVGMATAVVKDMYCIPRINYELAKINFQRDLMKEFGECHIECD